jgi:hypothetical protein
MSNTRVLFSLIIVDLILFFILMNIVEQHVKGREYWIVFGLVIVTEVLSVAKGRLCEQQQ